MNETIQQSDAVDAPFPWFGGKREIAPLVWERFGNPDTYIEPFFGSGAMLLNRPLVNGGTETVNDIDANLANFWRSVQAEPDEMAALLDWPVNESDLVSRHIWLVNTGSERAALIQSQPDYYDLKAAAWWCWGACCWIGGGWCSGKGPWNTDGESLINLRDIDSGGDGVERKRPHLAHAGKGVNRKMPHLGCAGQGVNRQMPHLGGAGQGEHLRPWMNALAHRLRKVRVCCGDWTRVLGPSVRFATGSSCAVFLDPPYSPATGRRYDVYAHEASISDVVGAWALEHGADPRMRIALCGYEGEYDLPEWDVLEWKARGGYGSQGESNGRENCTRERIWFSPHCLKPHQGSLFS